MHFWGWNSHTGIVELYWVHVWTRTQFPKSEVLRTLRLALGLPLWMRGSLSTPALSKHRDKTVIGNKCYVRHSTCRWLSPTELLAWVAAYLWAPCVWHLVCVQHVPEEVLIQLWKWETVSASEKNPTRDVFNSLSELPARSVDLSAFNLTELVNGMLSRALKGNRSFQYHLD